MNPLIGDLRITITVDIPRLGWLPYDIRKNMVERDIRDAITDIAYKCTGSAENYTHVEMREIDLKRIDKT